MNCKPGDLAFLIAAPQPEHIGLIVEVLRAGNPLQLKAPFQRFSGPAWWVRASRPCITTSNKRLTEFVLPDAALRPIRPGDISDEEVRDLYAPKQLESSHA